MSDPLPSVNVGDGDDLVALPGAPYSIAIDSQPVDHAMPELPPPSPQS